MVLTPSINQETVIHKVLNSYHSLLKRTQEHYPRRYRNIERFFLTPHRYLKNRIAPVEQFF